MLPQKFKVSIYIYYIIELFPKFSDTVVKEYYSLLKFTYIH